MDYHAVEIENVIITQIVNDFATAAA